MGLALLVRGFSIMDEFDRIFNSALGAVLVLNKLAVRTLGIVTKLEQLPRFACKEAPTSIGLTFLLRLALLGSRWLVNDILESLLLSLGVLQYRTLLLTLFAGDEGTEGVIDGLILLMGILNYSLTIFLTISLNSIMGYFL